MPGPTDRIFVLIKNHLEQNITEAERHELEEWMNESSLNKEAVAAFLEDEKLHEGIRGMYQMRRKVWDRLQKQLDISKVVPLARPSTSLRIWWRYAAAAVVPLLLSVGGYFYFNNSQKQIAKIIQPAKDVAAPKGSKAVITLSNGQNVLLDSLNNGTLATQGNVTVVKTADEKIIYSGTSNEVVYNTLTNPRGSNVVDITLADGSRVWLNAGSSLTYPISFAGEERKVQITGEGYFEVTHNSAMPFVVQKNNVNVQVVGTHFNVNTYEDEAEIKITLLEGSVKVENGKSSSILKPGQQANVGSEIKVKSHVDIEQVIAWKNGRFHFLNGTNITAIMRQVSRWYDVEVEYLGDVSNLNFSGKMSRKENASSLLEILKATGTVDFSIENNKIIVISK